MASNTATKPTAIPPSIDTIPAFMRNKPRWVLWRYAERGGKWTKIPSSPNGDYAKSTVETTWATLPEVQAAYERGGFDGVGFVLTGDDDLFVVDLDGQDIENLDTSTRDWLAGLETLIEVSASGRGLHLWLQGDRPDWMKAANKWGTRNRSGEVYFAGRYIAWTGQRHELSSEFVARCDTSEPWFSERWPAEGKPKGKAKAKKSKPSNNGHTAGITDEIIKMKILASKAGKTHWFGSIGLHPSQSEADLALCSIMAKHGADAEQIDRLFRQSGLMREKWNRDDYRTATIEKALEQRPKQTKEAKEAEETDEDGREPASKLDAMETAENFLIAWYDLMRQQSLWFWRDEFYEFEQYVYRKIPLPELRAKLIKYVTGFAFKINTRTTNNFIDALKALCIRSYRDTMPMWLGKAGKDLPPFSAAECLVAKNKILHLPTMQSIPNGPNLLTVNAIDFSYDPDSECPHWLTFLDSLWADDADCIATLQELFGYLLLPDTAQQKIALLVGPKRSGKGTIARILRALIGSDNVCAPTLWSLGESFGLQPLLGKTLAIIGDARLSGRNDASAIAERLLSISGEDLQTINRKNLPAVSCPLPTRFLILSNELPALSDASGTVASRFVVMPLKHSFYGREDQTLFDRLCGELPGILNWAITGYQRLRQRGFFVNPASADELIEEMEALSSSVSAFLKERCDIEPGAQERVDDVWAAWRSWSARAGRLEGSKQVFGRNLRAAAPSITTKQTRAFGGIVRVYEGMRLMDDSAATAERTYLGPDSHF